MPRKKAAPPELVVKSKVDLVLYNPARYSVEQFVRLCDALEFFGIRCEVQFKGYPIEWSKLKAIAEVNGKWEIS